MDPLSGENVKGYELQERIGAGGFGAVYKARQTTIERDVAIKIIKPGYANHPDFIRRFEAEAQLVTRLEHPYIVPLYDYWRDPDGAYLVMRYFRGGSVRDAIKVGVFDLQSAMRLMEQVTAALATAHRNNVIHRDLKPENILLDEDGNHYLADFGIAKDAALQTDDGSSLEQIKGTPDYLSPEQARGEAVTPQTDIYSLGVLLYEVLTGEHPFPQLSGVERLFKHLNESLPLIQTQELPDGVNDVIQRATAKNPAHRYADVLEMVAALREFVRESPNTSIVELFTMREQEVLQQMIGGRSNREIAETLFITIETVRWYLKQIYKKLRVRNRVQAIARARELNLLVADPYADLVPVNGEADGANLYLPELNNPYKGLRAFQSSDTQDFFGREKLIARLVKRLGESGDMARFLAVIGPSGSGKSSLVKAGLIPALWRGELPGSDRWFVVDMLPGSRPLDELEVALVRVAANQGANLREQLARDENGLLRVAQLILPDDGSELVLIIDQFEELFILVDDESERSHFLNLLYAAVTDRRSRLRIVVTLRADFYDRPLMYPAFGSLLRDRMETVLPLSAKELESVILGPAQRVGVQFEEGLAATIITEVSYQPGALPLLQYALTTLFEQREQRRLTQAAYQRIGGAVAALAQRAEEIFHELDTEGQEATRQIFLRLVTLGEGVEDTRRRTARSELEGLTDNADLLADIIDSFASARLLSLDHDPMIHSPTVELAHEAILREWERLRLWLNESRDDIRLQRQLAAMAEDWTQAGKDNSFLLHGSRLGHFETWAGDAGLVITEAERRFLETSITAHQQQVIEEHERSEHEAALERLSVRRLRWLVAVFAGATLIALALLLLLTTALNDVAAERDRAETQRQIAVSRELAAAAVSNLSVDPERSALLALYGLSQAHTREAENALHEVFAHLHILDTLTGHQGLVKRVSYSPDGQLLATSSWDGTAKLWDVESHALLRTFSGHQGFVQDVAFSPDLSRLATGGADGLVIVWDVTSGERLLTLEGHGTNTVAFHQGVMVVKYAPDGSLIATGGTDSTVRLWDAASGEALKILEGHTSAVMGLAFSPDGARIATGDWDGNGIIWDIATGAALRQWKESREIFGVAYSPDGSRLAISGGSAGVAKIRDAESSAEVLELVGHEGSLEGIAFSPEGERVATASWDGSVRVWDATSGQELLQLDGHNGNVNGVAFHPDGIRLASVSADTTIKVWDTSPSHELFTLTAGQGPTMSALSPDGSLLAAGALIDGPMGLRIWDAASAEPLRRMEPPPELLDEDGAAVVRDIMHLAFSPDGQYLAASISYGDVYLWDVATGAYLRTFSGHRAWLWGLAFSPDGSRLATASHDMTAKVWDVQTGQQLLTLSGHNNWIWSIDYSPDGRRLVTASRDNSVKVWDAAGGTELLSWSDPDVIGDFDAHFSPDGTRIVVGRENGSSVVLNADTGKILLTLRGHRGLTFRNVFNAEGDLIATASFDGTTKLWDADTGEELLTLYGHTNNVANVAFSPDSHRLVTSGFDGTVRAYTLNLEALVDLAQARVTRAFSLDECHWFLHADPCPELISMVSSR